jgi:hypothetical protein
MTSALKINRNFRRRVSFLRAICILTFLSLGLSFALVPAPRDTVAISTAAENETAPLRCASDGALRKERILNFEPYAAVNPHNPKNLVSVWMAEGVNERYFIRQSASFDGGEHWLTPRTLPLTACSGGKLDLLQVATDPWIAFGPDGRVYASAQAYLEQPVITK